MGNEIQPQGQSPGVKSLTTLSPTSAEAVAKNVRYLAGDFEVAPRLTEAEAGAVILDHQGRDMNACGIARADTFAEILVNLCPPPQEVRLSIFIRGVSAYLASQPISFVEVVCDPVKGLSTHQKYALKIADIHDALEAERKRHHNVLANARWVMSTAQQRRREAEEQAYWDAKWESETPEQRGQRLAAMSGKMFVAQSIPRPERHVDDDSWKADLAAQELAKSGHHNPDQLKESAKRLGISLPPPQQGQVA
jgi:hypothetical protein